MPEKSNNNGQTLRWALGILVSLLMLLIGINYRSDARTAESVHLKSDRTECVQKKTELKQEMREVEQRLVKRFDKMEIRQEKRNEANSRKLDRILEKIR
ncbi:MAG: hypothetical protein GY853_13470 [PVC group bacterium]|nr:hypothetical protein [PVC group bacterium]